MLITITGSFTLWRRFMAAGNIVIGFEAFPRRLQPVLDDWIEGKLTAEAFLKASEWRQVWGYDAALYMPLFQFARLNRIPMIALNVERSLVARVGQQGWASVPASEREGLSDPAPASPAYQRELARIYLMKKIDAAWSRPRRQALRYRTPPEPDEAALADAMKEPEFQRFVEAQLTWDRAMAEALAGAKRKFSNATIVGVLGSGHVQDGHGVPHQLKDLGVTAHDVVHPGIRRCGVQARRHLLCRRRIHVATGGGSAGSGASQAWRLSGARRWCAAHQPGCQRKRGRSCRVTGRRSCRASSRPGDANSRRSGRHRRSAGARHLAAFEHQA